jgi:hypothetical protein
LLAWWIAAAFAADKKDVAEEIIVYGDDFARWDNTRWLVQTELMLPLGVTFASEQNQAFFSHAFQIRAVIACDKDAKLSRKRWEVSCEIEDVGLLVTTFRQWRRERDREVVQKVLDELDAKLTGLDIQMQVDETGGVTNFDLEGLVADNSRERNIQESLRQVVSRMMAGFHLRIPDHAQRAGQWIEYHSELMDIPSLTSSRGSSTMVHLVTPYKDGLQIVQTVGEGSASVNLPSYSKEVFSTSRTSEAVEVDSGKSAGFGAVGGATADAPELNPIPSSDGPGTESDIEATFAMKASGVAVFRKSDGIMSERVWVVTGMPTASAGGGTLSAPFANKGRIQMLGENDRPNVGSSMQVAWPGRAMTGLEPWISIEAMPEE